MGKIADRIDEIHNQLLKLDDLDPLETDDERQKLFEELGSLDIGDDFVEPEREEPPAEPPPPPPPAPAPEPSVVTLTVRFDEKKVYVTSNLDTEIEWGGDVRDGVSKLEAGKEKSRTLTSKEGNGFVSIDGREYDY